MIPAAFEYRRAASVDDAVALLAEHGGDAKVLAGGHSLVPLLRLRFARPALLVDLGRVDGLAGVRNDGDVVSIGAMTTYCDLESSPIVASRAPLLAAAASEVGDPQVRHRGTIGGSLCHGDPASDVAAALLALDATLVVRGEGGERHIAVADVFVGFLETAIGPEELLTEIRVPATSAPWAFEKFNRRAQDWAIVGCAVLGGPTPRIALVNMATTPVRSAHAESALASGAAPGDAAQVAGDGLDPPSDANASADYRSHLARVLVARALSRACP